MQQTTSFTNGCTAAGGTSSCEGGATGSSVPNLVVAVLLDVRAVAAMVGCSSRNIYRLSDGGRMPRPVKIGRLVRWRRTDIEAWIAAGCPSCR